jgi:hypothetical protein
MHFNLTRLAVAAIVWAIVQDLIKLSRPTIEEDRKVLTKEVLLLVAVVIGLVMYNR